MGSTVARKGFPVDRHGLTLQFLSLLLVIEAHTHLECDLNHKPDGGNRNQRLPGLERAGTGSLYRKRTLTKVDRLGQVLMVSPGQQFQHREFQWPGLYLQPATAAGEFTDCALPAVQVGFSAKHLYRNFRHYLVFRRRRHGHGKQWQVVGLHAQPFATLAQQHHRLAIQAQAPASLGGWQQCRIRIDGIEADVLPTAEQLLPASHLQIVDSRYLVAVRRVAAKGQVHRFDVLRHLFFYRKRQSLLYKTALPGGDIRHTEGGLITGNQPDENDFFQRVLRQGLLDVCAGAGLAMGLGITTGILQNPVKQLGVRILLRIRKRRQRPCIQAVRHGYPSENVKGSFVIRFFCPVSL